jgi:hypothetical protein
MDKATEIAKASSLELAMENPKESTMVFRMVSRLVML